MEAVGVGGNAAHRMHGDRPAGHPLVPPSGPVRPRLLDRHRLLERGAGDLGGDPPNRCRRHAGRASDGVGCELRLLVAAYEKFERGRPRATVGETVAAGQCRRDLGRERRRQFFGPQVPAQRCAVLVPRDQPVLRTALVPDHQPRRVGVADQEFGIDAAGAQQLVHEGKYEQSVGAGPDSDPFVGDRRVAGSYRVDGDELRAIRLELGKPDLDRIGVVILGDPEHEQQAGVFPVGLAELPERSADRVDPGRRHVDRAETPVRGMVRRAELARPPAGERLALIPSGEERELLRIRATDGAQPIDGQSNCVFPLDFLEPALAARADPP